MEANPPDRPSKLSAIILTAALLVGLHLAVAIVLRPFVMPFLWAIVLTTATWPTFARLRTLCPSRPWVLALLLTVVLGILLLMLTIPLPLKLAGELRQLGEQLRNINVDSTFEMISEIPFIGGLLAGQLSSLLKDEGGISAILAAHQADLIRYATQAAKGIFETIAIIIMALAGCFILYVHGESLVDEARAIMRKLGSTRGDYIFEYIAVTVRGAAYSVIAVAIAQGALAGIGYSIAGAPLPLLFAVTTALASLLPFGAPLLYVPMSAYLVFGTELPWYHGIGLLLWGVGLVSTVDNILRSILISQATRVSAIVVFLGVVGGVMAFGLLGVFIGPALVGVTRTLWHDFAHDGEA